MHVVNTHTHLTSFTLLSFCRWGGVCAVVLITRRRFILSCREMVSVRLSRLLHVRDFCVLRPISVYTGRVVFVCGVALPFHFNCRLFAVYSLLSPSFNYLVELLFG